MCGDSTDEAHSKKGQFPPIADYRLQPDKTYGRITPDAHGHVWIDAVRMALGPYGIDIAWFDENGNIFEDYNGVIKARKQAEERAEQEKHRAEQAENRIRDLEAELCRLRGAT